jgi:hypothetical protein
MYLERVTYPPHIDWVKPIGVYPRNYYCRMHPGRDLVSDRWGVMMKLSVVGGRIVVRCLLDGHRRVLFLHLRNHGSFRVRLLRELRWRQTPRLVGLGLRRRGCVG